MDTDQDRDDRAILVSNERLKLRATFLNRLAVAIFAVGGVAPVVTAFTALAPPTLRLTALCLVCLCASYGLHVYAMRLLGGMR